MYYRRLQVRTHNCHISSLTQAMTSSRVESASMLAGHTAVSTKSLQQSGRNLLQSQAGVVPEPGPASAPALAPGLLLSLTAGINDIQVCCKITVQACLSMFTFTNMPDAHAASGMLQTIAQACSSQSYSPLCLAYLQIPVAAELQVTCPFVVPFNQASQVHDETEYNTHSTAELHSTASPVPALHAGSLMLHPCSIHAHAIHDNPCTDAASPACGCCIALRLCSIVHGIASCVFSSGSQLQATRHLLTPS